MTCTYRAPVYIRGYDRNGEFAEQVGFPSEVVGNWSTATIGSPRETSQHLTDAANATLRNEPLLGPR